jgi:hypothetical protein
MEDKKNGNIYDIDDFIKSSLDKLDKSNKKYENLINKKSDEIELPENENKIIFYKDKEKISIVNEYKKSILGYFDIKTKVWLWAWVLPFLNMKETDYARKILNYGLNFDPTSNSAIHYYIKSHFINSRIYFETDIYLDIHLALALSISKGKFIYRVHLKDTNSYIYHIIH